MTVQILIKHTKQYYYFLINVLKCQCNYVKSESILVYKGLEKTLTI